MDLTFSPELNEFRKEVRDFLRENVPEDLRRKTRHEEVTLPAEDHRRLTQILFKRGGWNAPNWPKKYGGPGWSFEQQYIFERELALNDVPRLVGNGVGMLGPALMEYGSEQQKEKFLPSILKGEILWCQGYSEPNAGSDLASLKTRAERADDEYIVNGTKIWTTDGHSTDWMFALVRTDNSGKKQHGITVLLFDMKSAGIDIKPIITFDGAHEVNQVFFTNLRVPVSQRLGEENQGWTVAKYILGFERFGTAEVSRSLASLKRLKILIKREKDGIATLAENNDFSGAIAQAEVELLALEATEQKIMFGAGGPDAMGAEASMLKIRGTEVQQRILELTLEALAHYGIPDVPEQGNPQHNQAQIGPEETSYSARTYYNKRKTSIYSGSNEIQKNIIAKAVLGL